MVELKDAIHPVVFGMRVKTIVSEWRFESAISRAGGSKPPSRNMAPTGSHSDPSGNPQYHCRNPAFKGADFLSACGTVEYPGGLKSALLAVRHPIRW